ncbi:MAG: hypothetical protein J0M12_03475 [Deltaproteobacteria bacterium]|nr:hypothetical protein [Deltaproteobacteria bacterium]
MKALFTRTASAFVLCFGLICQSAQADAPEYSVRAIPSGDANFYAFQPRQMNNYGDVAGSGARVSPSAGRALIYTQSNGFFSPHGTENYPYSHGAIINDNGDISFIFDGDGNSGFGGDQTVARWSPVNGLTNFGRVLPDAVSAQSTNQNGQRIVGYAYYQNSFQGFCIGCSVSGPISTGSFYPLDINSAGVMTGYGPGATSYGVGIYSNGQLTMLNSLLPDGGQNSVGVAINDSGDVAAYSQVVRQFPGFYRHAFLLTTGQTYDLGTLGDLHWSSYPTDVNSGRSVVGYTYLEGTPQAQWKAFVWDSSRGMRDLNALVPPGSVNGLLTMAYSVNNSGQILVYADPQTGRDGTYYVLTPITATPTPTPTSTVTASPTATIIPTRTATATPTRTPTRTATPTSTPKSSITPCRRVAVTPYPLAAKGSTSEKLSLSDYELSAGCVTPRPTGTVPATPTPYPTSYGTKTPSPTMTPTPATCVGCAEQAPGDGLLH